MIGLGIIYSFYILFVVINSLKIISRNFWQSEDIQDNRLVVSDIIHTIIGPIIGFNRYDAFGPDIPFAKTHVGIIIFLVIVASLSFWISRIAQKQLHPILKMGLSVGILQGMILCIITTIHFVPYLLSGLVFPMFGFELLTPFIAFFLLLKEFYSLQISLRIRPETGLVYQKLGMVTIPHELINNFIYYRIFFYPLLLIGLVVFEIGFMTLFGFAPDSLLKVFTESKGFIFSINHN